MKILAIGRHSTEFDREEDFLEVAFTSIEWAQAVGGKAEFISVFGFGRNNVLKLSDQTVFFIKDLRQGLAQKFYVPFYRKINQMVKKMGVDILHIHNLGDSLTIGLLTFLHKKHAKIIVQDHGSLPRRKNRLLSRCYKNVDAFIFNSKGQEEDWLKQGILDESKCHFVLENSSPFEFKTRELARNQTKMIGDPVLIWVGNLIPMKDPMTLLEATSTLIKKFPKLKLYVFYRRENIEHKVLEYIDQHQLTSHVMLMGSRSRNELADYYNSADLFISASHKEGSGYTAIEAMSCGVIPILTDIPSFRHLTKNGQVGRLWPIGDVAELVAQVTDVLQRPIDSERRKVLHQFREELSYDRMAKDYLKICKQLVHGGNN